MRSDELKELAASYFTKKRMCVHFEVGLNRRGQLRADVIALSMRGELVIVEVKSSVRDFKSDHKWQGYLDFCHRFYFLMDEDVYEKVQHLIPTGVGVMLPKQHATRTGRVRTVARVKKNASRKALKLSLIRQLAIRLAFRSADRNRYRRGK